MIHTATLNELGIDRPPPMLGNRPMAILMVQRGWAVSITEFWLCCRHSSMCVRRNGGVFAPPLQGCDWVINASHDRYLQLR